MPIKFGGGVAIAVARQVEAEYVRPLPQSEGDRLPDCGEVAVGVYAEDRRVAVAAPIAQVQPQPLDLDEEVACV